MPQSILERWDITIEELTRVIDHVWRIKYYGVECAIFIRKIPAIDSIRYIGRGKSVFGSVYFPPEDPLAVRYVRDSRP